MEFVLVCDGGEIFVGIVFDYIDCEVEMYGIIVLK